MRYISGILTFISLSLIKIKAPVTILILDRFWEGSGWIEIITLSLYSVWISNILINAKKANEWIRTRRIVWLFFSVIFFFQLFLGISGFAVFLMTGKLHLPIPAMIIAGPLFRGEGFFMLFLFIITVLLVGSGWCSWLCYFGAWDFYAASSKGALKRPETLNLKTRVLQYISLAVVIIAALMLRYYEIGRYADTLQNVSQQNYYHLIASISFGVIGIFIMIFASRKKGIMLHCTVWCPIGIPATILGKINPFRIRIDSKCDECLACSRVCRYNALSAKDIASKKPASSCTLCGDCIGTCHSSSISYKLFNIKTAREIYIMLILTLHSIFLGCARI